MLQLLQAISKWGVIISFLLLLLSLLYKDRLPDPDHFEIKRLVDPVQESTFRSPFWIEAEGEREKYEKQMDLIKTQREYEALDKEIRDSSLKEQELLHARRFKLVGDQYFHACRSLQVNAHGDGGT